MHKTTWFRGLNVLLMAAFIVGWMGGCGCFASKLVRRMRGDRIEQGEAAPECPGSEEAPEKARNDGYGAHKAHKSGDLEEAERAIRSGDEGRSDIDSGSLETIEVSRSPEEWYERTASPKEGPAESSIPALLKELEEEVETPSPPSEESVVAEIAAGCDLPIDTNRRVWQGIRYFRTRGRNVFRRWLERSGRYLPMMREIFEEEGLPLDLSYLAMVESGMNPQARSWADARGLWQFIGSTGRQYGLKQTWWLDERLDPAKATRAAARHLKALKKRFGDWRLAIAAYNCGAGRVRQAMRRAHSEDFWRLRLPRETRNYVPSFMAAVILSKRPEIFGFGDVAYEAPLAFDEVTLDGCTDLRVVARCMSDSYQTLKTYQTIEALNPELRRWCTPPGVEGYRLRLPKGTASLFLSQYALVSDSEKIEWRRHRVRRGEALSQIAREYRVSMHTIMEVNTLRNPHHLRTGEVLLIPMPKQEGARLAGGSFQSLVKGAGERALYYVVRKGDTLSEIAQAYGVGLSPLRQWNGLRGNLIRPGQRLKIWLPEHRESMFAASSTALGPSGRMGEHSLRSAETYYVVRRGDTLSEIARRHGTTVGELYRWNGLQGSLIRPGERLIISK